MTFARWWLGVWAKSGYVKTWSTMYRALYEKAFVNVPIEPVANFTELEKRLDKLQWTGDAGRELGDAWSSPQRIQAVLNLPAGAPPIHGIDCEDFALYICAVAKKSGLADPRVFVVQWTRPDKKLAAHAVALWQQPGSTYFWMDYNAPNAATTLAQAADQVAGSQQGVACPIVGWALFRPDLTCQEVGP